MGSVAEWVSALATVGALIAAVYAGKVARNLFDLETKRDDAVHQLQRQEQARQVSAWAVVDPDEGTSGIEIVNSSSSPVYDVEIQATKSDGSTAPPLDLALLPPGRFYSTAGVERFYWSIPDPSDSPLRPVSKTDGWRVQQLTFRDSANIRWTRHASGHLEELRSQVAVVDSAVGDDCA